MRVLVRGAGVAGLALARELLARGHAVEIADTAAAVGAGASGLAGGMLAPFCEGEAAPESVTRLGQMAAGWWEAALPAGHVRRTGTLVLAPARDAGELARFAARTKGHETLDAAAVAALEPALAGRFGRGLFFAGEAHLDPRKALAALRERLSAAGAVFRLSAPADLDAGSFDAEADCTGSAAIGEQPGLRAVRGEMLHLETPEIALARPVRLLHPRQPVYVVPRDAGRFMVGATMIESADAGPVSARSLMELLNAAYALHPAFGEARVVETAAGLRPAFDDNLPRVAGSGRRFRINGFHRHGFLLAPAIAREAADLITERRTAA